MQPALPLSEIYQVKTLLNFYKIKKKINMLRKIWIVPVASAAILTKSPTNAMIIIACCLL
jgi:hypothetical protein